MNCFFKRLSPYLLILLGLVLLFILGMAIPAGLLILVGIVIVIERVCPEEWGLK